MPSRLVLIALICVLVAVRTLVAARLRLSDDEAYYRLWSLVPAASYLDHPPMVGWWIAVGRWLAGDTMLGVRLMSLAAFLVGTAAMWRAATLLFGAEIARLATLFALAMPLLGVGSIIITPDGPTVLCWVLAIWAMAELIRSQHGNWWLAVGLFAGMGLLSKYTNLFLGAGLVLWLLAVPSQRRWLAAWQLWAGGAIALACAVPVIAWNAEHEWASFAKQFGRVTRGHELTTTYLIELAGGFVALASPVIAGLAIYGLFLMGRRAARERPPAETLTIALLVPALLYFLGHALHARVQANWLAPLYPLLALSAAYAVAHVRTRMRADTLAAGAAAIGLAMTGLLYWHALSPLDGGLLRKDATDQTRGWDTLAMDIEAVRQATGAQWIATSSYATTGQLAFALRGRSEVHQLNERIRYVHLPLPARETVTAPALYVELERRQTPQLLAERFAEVERLADLPRRSDGQVHAVYAVYRVAGPRGDVVSSTR